MDERTAKAVEEAAKAAQALAPVVDKSVSLVTDTLRWAGGLLGRPLSVASAMLADAIYARQMNARLSIIERVRSKIGGRSIPPECVPDGFLVPFFDACGNVQDAEMQDLWAELLARATESDAAKNSAFIQALRSMSPGDARALKELLPKLSEQGGRLGMGVTPLRGYPPHSVEQSHLCSLGIFDLVASNADPSVVILGPQGNNQYWELILTPFGESFVQALGFTTSKR